MWAITNRPVHICSSPLRVREVGVCMQHMSNDVIDCVIMSGSRSSRHTHPPYM